MKKIGCALLVLMLCMVPVLGLTEEQVADIRDEFGSEVSDALQRDLDDMPIRMGAMSATSQGWMTIIQGTVFDDISGEPLPYTYLDVYCNHSNDINKISRTGFRTNDAGNYLTWTMNLVPNKRCEEGDRVWAVVDYQDQEWETERVQVESEPRYDFARVDAFVGVPEFSIWTLGLAVILGTIGLALFRARL